MSTSGAARRSRAREGATGLLVPIFLLLVSVSTAAPAAAAIGAWSAQGPEGGQIHSFAIDPVAGSALYAGTYGGLFKSTNGGESWSWIARSVPSLWISGVAVDPTDPQVLYLSDWESNRVFRSEDGGETWTALSVSVGRSVLVEQIVIDPTNPARLYGASYDGLVKSTDRGATWELAETGLPTPEVYCLLLHPANPTILFAGTENGLFRSADRATTWAAFGSGLPPGNITALAVDPVTPSTLFAAGGSMVYRSTDGGATWVGVGSLSQIEALVVDPSDPSIVYAAGGHGVYRSDDGGTSWVSASAGLSVTGGAVSYLALDPLHPETVFAGTYDGVFRSTDGASSWTFASRGLVASDVRALAGTAAGTAVYAGTNGSGLHRSTDGGATWQSISVPVPFVDAVVADPDDPQTLYLGAGGAFKSTDAGAHWTQLSGVSAVQSWAIDPTDPSIVYAASLYAGVFKSTDGGDSWTASNIGVDTLDTLSLAMDPSHPATLYLGTRDQGVYKTTNGGASWTPVGAGVIQAWAHVVTVDPVSPATVYVGTVGGGLYRSTDAGATWVRVYGDGIGSQIYALAIDPTDPSLVYAAGNARVARSEDGGATWATMGVGPRSEIVFALLLDPRDPAKVYAGGLGGGVADFDQRAPTAVFTSEEYPGFRFGVRITAGGQEMPVQKEAQCISETVCISGAVPGRAELFLRIVGPKPNGYLWPTLVKFSTSTLEVWITQTATGITKYYRLEGAGPASSDLPGYFDRTGFLPTP